MTYPSVHTGPEIDAAVSVLSDVQDIRDQVAADKSTVTTLAGQTATNATLAQTAATNAQADAASALASKNDAHTSAQTAGAHAANADSSRALAVVARNGAEEARDSAWEAEEEVRYLLGESEATIDSIRAEILRQKYGAGPYPSLDIGMVGANVLDRRVTFTRASDATYWDSLSLLKTAGPNEPRFEYDPVTGESLGLLVEGQATNLLLNSDDLRSPPWGSLGGATVDPEPTIVGGIRLFRVVTGVGSTASGRDQTVNVTANVAYSFSVYAKRAECRYAQIRLYGVDESICRVMFDLESGEVVNNQSVFTNIGAEELPSGIYRLRVTYPGGSSIAMQPRLIPCLSQDWSHGPDGVSGAYFGAPQLEAGTSPTSYIKTESSQVTRAADGAHVDVGEWLNPLQGTLIYRGTAGSNRPYWDGYAVLLNTTNNYIGILSAANSESVRARVVVDGVVGSPWLQKNVSPGQEFCAAISYSSTEAMAAINGEGAVAVGLPPAGLAYGIERLDIGKFGNPGTTNAKHITSIAYYPRALSDAQLVELTTI